MENENNGHQKPAALPEDTKAVSILNAENKRRMETRKSLVRVVVTYVAMAFVFVLGGFFVIWELSHGDNPTEAKNIFNAILPIAAGVIAYWFANRSADKARDNNTKQTPSGP